MLNPSLKTLTSSPGVYLMLDARGEIIYVGKAKNLHKRVNSYFSREQEDLKTQALLREIRSFDVTVTRSETEALILENQLIKMHKPKYNIVFKDDKSYPYVHLSTQHDFPRLSTYRGERKKEGLSFGPYPTMASTRETLQLLQKIFRLRDCQEAFFKNRSRPCLQYQLQRCSAPCVQKISAKDYAEEVTQVKLFLQGKSQKILTNMGDLMDFASKHLEFERAAELRDQIQSLRKLQSSQGICSETTVDLDVIALRSLSGFFAIAVLMIRGGRVLGARIHYPEKLALGSSDEVLSAFISHFYTETSDHLAPEIYLTEKMSAEAWAELQAWMPEKLKIQNGSTKISKLKLKWREMAELNAKEALKSKFSSQFLRHERLIVLKERLGISSFSRAIGFDVSHSLGESSVVSCVVFEESGPNKKEYRRFNIDGAGGDDCAALKEAVFRYFSRQIKAGNPLPSLVLIDGGLGQVNAVLSILSSFPEVQALRILGISKAEFRTSGFEQLWEGGEKQPQIWDPDDLALHFLQEIRDEAHRFALSAHRKQRAKKRVTSVLEHIPGIGKKRRQALLTYFGSLNALKSANLEELRRVPGVHDSVAKKIYDWAKGA